MSFGEKFRVAEPENLKTVPVPAPLPVLASVPGDINAYTYT
jgi:hypothetical protein